jgi:hypothetical protein
VTVNKARRVKARDLEPDFSFLSYTITTMAGQAGQSSRLRASQASQTQNGSLKRKRYENIEEMFEAVDPEENERLSRQYRQLIQKADGELTPTCSRRQADMCRDESGSGEQDNEGSPTGGTGWR